MILKGYLVGITGRRRELLENFCSEHGDSCYSEVLDVTQISDLENRLERLIDKLGGLDILIISSGTGDINEYLDFSIEHTTIETNVTGFTYVASWVFNFFQKQNHGHLVTISSVGGLRGSRQSPAYNASKAWQINYIEGLRQKAFHCGNTIHITDIRPGLINTAMAKGEGLFWVMPVEKACRQMLRAIEKKRRIVYVTRRWGLIARILKRIPGCIYSRM